MTALVIFATVEGQSARIARFAAKVARQKGREAMTFDTSKGADAPSFDGIERIVLVAPVHERRHPESFENFLTAHKPALAARPTLMLSVSLSAAFPAGLEDSEDYLTEMKMRTGLAPDREMLVPGAVRHLSYDYYEAQVMEHIVLRGRDEEAKEKDREFTDWEALRTELEIFLSE